ncbi:MAG: hypothetical protein FJY85_13220 [Deltaproteobacteria bacterium]|nr:hypothetical protein [Deltaproteobacteria bacterium]
MGITKPETIVEEVGRRNKTRTRIFSLAIGERADVAMLDKLAVSAKGASVHVAGAEEFDAALGRLFAAVSPPNVSDASIDSVPVTLKDLVPSPIPDLVGTESVVIFGRYEHEGDRESKVRLRAKIEGRQTSLSKSIVFSESAPEHAYLPGMWAMRRMAQLLGQARVKGRTPEGTRQIEHLAGQFGFAIPAALTPTDTSPRSPDSSGDSGRLLWNFKRSFILSEVMSDACRSIDGKAFCFDNSRWIDSDYRTTMATRTIRFLSNEYFSLLNKTPDLGKYLALGPDVTIVHEKQAIRVTNGQ